MNQEVLVAIITSVQTIVIAVLYVVRKYINASEVDYSLCQTVQPSRN